MTAGMLTENTTAYDLAKRMVEQPSHGIFFVGYADPETPGGRLKAAKQGATNLGKLGNTRTPQNACRGLVRALPKGSSAPDIDFIEVPGPDGKNRPHPNRCPIKTLEIVINNFNTMLFFFQKGTNFIFLFLNLNLTWY